MRDRWIGGRYLGRHVKRSCRPGTFGFMGTRKLSASHGRYLEILGVEPDVPGIAHLRRLVRAQVQTIMFENVSKLFYLQARGLRGAPDLDTYLDGIEGNGFGGTCYTNNPHFCDLLRALGYEVRLCGADMARPDVHTAILVWLDGREYLVDAGYAAPFITPLPRDLDADLEIRMGNECWVLKPSDVDGRSTVEHHRNGSRIHGYVVKPIGRTRSFFRQAIQDSYRADATFMNTLRLVRFGDDWSVAISDLDVIRSTPTTCAIQRLESRDGLVRLIAEEFLISPEITNVALTALRL